MGGNGWRDACVESVDIEAALSSGAPPDTVVRRGNGGGVGEGGG